MLCTSLKKKNAHPGYQMDRPVGGNGGWESGGCIVNTELSLICKTILHCMLSDKFTMYDLLNPNKTFVTAIPLNPLPHTYMSSPPQWPVESSYQFMPQICLELPKIHVLVKSDHQEIQWLTCSYRGLAITCAMHRFCTQTSHDPDTY